MEGTGTSVAPGSRLHVLTIGVGDYGAKADHLDLDFADDDAEDLARVVVSSQDGLYAEVRPQMLLNADATRRGILRAFATLREDMAKGNGNDVALVQFSGHGAMIDDKFYLLPHEVDATDAVSIRDTALEATSFKDEVARLAGYGRVIVLLDACRSGAATASGEGLQADASRLRDVMRGENTAVLTSSTAEQGFAREPGLGARRLYRGGSRGADHAGGFRIGTG